MIYVIGGMHIFTAIRLLFHVNLLKDLNRLIMMIIIANNNIIEKIIVLKCVHRKLFILVIVYSHNQYGPRFLLPLVFACYTLFTAALASAMAEGDGSADRGPEGSGKTRGATWK